MTEIVLLTDWDDNLLVSRSIKVKGTLTLGYRSYGEEFGWYDEWKEKYLIRTLAHVKVRYDANDPLAEERYCVEGSQYEFSKSVRFLLF